MTQMRKQYEAQLQAMETQIEKLLIEKNEIVASKAGGATKAEGITKTDAASSMNGTCSLIVA